MCWYPSNNNNSVLEDKIENEANKGAWLIMYLGFKLNLLYFYFRYDENG